MSDNEALRLADALEFPFAAPSVKEQHAAAAELRRLAAVEAERVALLALIADDAFAAAFHTIYWYQRALLKSAKGGGNG